MTIMLHSYSLLQHRRVAAPFAAATGPLLTKPRVLPARGWRFVARSEGQGGNAAPPQQQQQQQQPAEEEEELLDIEKQLLAKRRKPKEPKGPKVISPVRDQVYGGGPLSPGQVLENRVVGGLSLFFLFILAEGLFLGASGFMSEGVDRFATDVVYPAFGPTIGVFLLMSSAYGLWKTYGPGVGPSGKQ